jgi:putative MATE family efflux protein
MNPRPPLEDADAAREVEGDLEDLGDADASPTTPAGTLAVAAGSRAKRGVVAGSSEEIWRLAWPVMLSLTLASIVGIADIAMVGRLGASAQAAVGYAAQLFFVAQSALFALSFACVALMARAIGAGRAADARHALAASLIVAVGGALLLYAAIALHPLPLLRALSAGPEVIALCVPYLQLLMASTVLLSVCLTFEAGFRADRDTKTPMQVAIAVAAAKLGLNVLLIFGAPALAVPAFGVVGAGLATLLSQCLAVVLFVWLTRRKPADSPSTVRLADFRGIRPWFGPLIRIALPGVGERLIMNLAMVVYFAFIGTYGTAAAAAYTIGIRILSFTWIPGTGYAQAVATLVGQALGADDVARAERSGWRAARLALATAIVMGLLGVVLREPLARLFTVDEATVVALGPFMLCLSLAQPAMQLHFTLGGAFRGAGNTMTPLYAAFVGNWLFRVPLAFLAASVWHLPLIWIWLTLILDHLARAIWLTVGFVRGTWHRRSGVVPTG